MKRDASGWIISALILLGSFTAKSQDSTKVANKDLRSGGAVFFEWQFQNLEIKAKDENIAIQQKKIEILSRQLAAYKKRDKTQANLINALKTDNKALEQQRDALTSLNKSFLKDNKKLKRKIVLAIATAVVCQAGTIYLLRN